VRFVITPPFLRRLSWHRKGRRLPQKWNSSVTVLRDEARQKRSERFGPQGGGGGKRRDRRKPPIRWVPIQFGCANLHIHQSCARRIKIGLRTKASINKRDPWQWCILFALRTRNAALRWSAKSPMRVMRDGGFEVSKLIVGACADNSKKSANQTWVLTSKSKVDAYIRGRDMIRMCTPNEGWLPLKRKKEVASKQTEPWRV